MKQGESGFTLMEMLLSVSIMVVLISLSLPIYESFQTRNDLAVNTQAVAETIRRAEDDARAVNGDSAWSVEIQSSAVTLFMGTSFAGRNTNYDEVVTLPASVTASGTSEIQFTKFTGAPSPTSATITLTSANGDTRTVTVNAKGMVQD